MLGASAHRWRTPEVLHMSEDGLTFEGSEMFFTGSTSACATWRSTHTRVRFTWP